MAKYRKKPVVIEAFKWTGCPEQTEDHEWIMDAIRSGVVWFNNVGTSHITMEIETLGGNLIARIGDYIIKGVNGEIYTCKPDIFRKTYELVEEE